MKQLDSVTTNVFSCIMDGVSGQLMRCVNDQLRDDMDRLCQLCDPFSQLSSDSLNIRPIYDCPLHHSVCRFFEIGLLSLRPSIVFVTATIFIFILMKPREK